MGSTRGRELGSHEYWDERYKTATDTTTGNEPTHEWFRGFKHLEPFLLKHLVEPKSPDYNPCLLHLGCGDSSLPLDLLSLGYRNQICIDFSSTVIDLMSQRNAHIPEIAWKVGDVRDMPDIENNTIDIAFDKGTLDAMIYGSVWDPPEEVVENIRRYIDEVARILKPGGIFLYVTYRQPHFMRKFLVRDEVWDLSVEELQDAPGAFGYFGWIMQKPSGNTKATSDS